jgi:hypothetical protein
MKYRIISSIFSAAALVLVVGVLVVPKTAQAEPAIQDPPSKTMFVIGHGPVQVLRLYDKPDPMGKTQKTVPVGMPIEIYTDQMYNNYWYKTTEGFYAHRYYLSETDPNLAVAAPEEEDVDSVERRRREDELLEKYKDLIMVTKILQGRIEIGFTMDQVRDSWGDPDSWRVLETTAMGDRVLWEYDSTPRRGATRLTFDYRKKLITRVTDK